MIKLNLLNFVNDNGLFPKMSVFDCIDLRQLTCTGHKRDHKNNKLSVIFTLGTLIKNYVNISNKESF